MKASLAALTSSLRSAQSSVVITDPTQPDHPIIYANAAFEALTGYAAHEVIGRNPRFLQGPDSDPAAVDEMRRAIAEGRDCRVTLTNYRKDGTPLSLQMSISPIVEHGQVTHFIGIQHDAALMDQAEQALEDVDFAQNVQDTVRESLLVLDANLRVKRANRAFYRTFSMTREETEGQLIYELGGAHWDIPALRLLLERILPATSPFDDFRVEAELPRIGRRTMLLNGRRLEREGRPEYILLAIEDITARLAHHRALRSAEHRYQLLLENTVDYGVFFMDPNGIITSWNAGAPALTGYADDELAGRHIELLFTPEDRAANVPQIELKEAALTGRAIDNRWLQRKDGSRLWGSGVLARLVDEDGNEEGYAKIVRDLTERKRFEEELWKRASELSERDRAKDEFLAMLSHELRNPLNALTSALYLVKRFAASVEPASRPLEIAERQVHHLGQLVNDLLDVSRITLGKIELRRVPMALNRVVESVVRGVTVRFEQRGLQLQIDAPREVPVLGDPLRLEQVLHNLLSNAVKFTERGFVRVSVAEEDGYAVLRVTDSGIGIAPDLLPQVFELFRQGERQLARTEGGLGIGLTLVRRLVELHGGQVSLRSAGKGQGSTATVRLPLYTGAGVPPPPPAVATPGGRSLRVLLVEDNADGAETVGALVSAFGHDVRIVHDGHAALAAALQTTPDLVLLDIGLPGKDGFAVASELRAQPALSHTLIVALTGYGRDEDKQRAWSAGIERYLVKPVTADALHEVMAVAGDSARRKLAADPV